ncbi:MAG TPA: PAC2 family protein [Acidimicrobiia bacterium]|jgi:proteasome assembly chaperone (PAC2) family protein|nr:PAC2 family protein [Acidimicrobiia bacterium]
MGSFEWLSRPKLHEPLAVLAFSGWGDAGESSTDAARHLIAEFEAETVGRFDSDPFFDFQVTRPVVSLDASGVRSISWPTTELLALRLPARDLVVVLGEEPNYNWKRFVGELTEALAELGVTTAVTLGAFVGQVAHTVPVPVVGSSSSSRMVATHGLLPSRYEGPTGIVGVLTQALANRGVDTISLWAAVPHYLSNQAYPPGVEALLRKAAEMADVDLDMTKLKMRSTHFRANVDAAVHESDELAEYVRQLEAEGMEEEGPGEDLVEEIERYLRDS